MPFLQVILSLPPDQRLLVPVFSQVAELTSQVSLGKKLSPWQREPTAPRAHEEPGRQRGGESGGTECQEELI